MAAALSVLGRPVVHIDGEPVPMQGKPLRLVIRLALAGQAEVSAEQLRASLWPDEPSESAVRVIVSRARASVGAERLLTLGGAYRLVDVTVDAHDFERRVAGARRSELSLADRAAAYGEALALWPGGPALDGARDLPWLAAVANTLDDLREQAIDEQARILTADGAYEEAIPSLQAGMDRLPLREERCALLATALYHCGRQADALAAINRVRRELRDQLGVFPSASLDDLERRILAHDPSLARSEPRRGGGSLGITAKIDAASTLIQARVFDEAAAILDAAESRALAEADRVAQAQVILARADMAMRSGHADPHPLIDDARDIARELRDGRLLARAALARVGAGVPDDTSQVLVELTEPIALLDDHDPEQVELLCVAAVFVMLIDAPEAGRRLVEEAQRRHDRFGTERTQVLVLLARSTVHSGTAEGLDEAGADADRALEMARVVDDPWLTITAIQPALRAGYLRGRLREVDGLLDELAELVTRATLPYGRVRVELGRATNALARADFAAAGQHHAEARRIAEEYRTFGTGRAVVTQALLLAWERGELAGFVELIAAQAELRGPSVWHAAAALTGDVEYAERLSDIVDKIPHDASYLPALALAAQVARLRGDGMLAEHCIAPLDALRDGAVLVGLGSATLGFAAHFAGLAAATMGDLAGAERRLRRAAVLGRTSGAALWEAHSLVELAAVLASNAVDPGAKHEAAELLARVRETSAAQGSARLAARLAEVDELLAAG